MEWSVNFCRYIKKYKKKKNCAEKKTKLKSQNSQVLLIFVYFVQRNFRKVGVGVGYIFSRNKTSGFFPAAENETSRKWMSEWVANVSGGKNTISLA